MNPMFYAVGHHHRFAKADPAKLGLSCAGDLEDRFLCPMYIRHIAISDPAREILRFIEEHNSQ